MKPRTINCENLRNNHRKDVNCSKSFTRVKIDETLTTYFQIKKN